MQSGLRWLWRLLFAIVLMACAVNDSYWAQGPKGAQAKAIFDSVGEIIDHGANLYNLRGDYAGCYRVYEAGLIAVKPFLAKRPDLQKAIDDGLAKAKGQPHVIDRAFTLRYVLGDIRKALRPSQVPVEKKPIEKKPVEKKKKKPKEKKVEAKKTLWDRLGGESNVTKVVDEFTRLAAKDAKVDFTRHGKYKLDAKALKAFKRKMVEFVSSATGGPLKYTGKKMKEAHKGMGITNAEFNAAKADLKKALEKFAVKTTDAGELLRIVETTRKDIVEPPVKKKEEKKKAEKKKVEKKKEEKTKEPAKTRAGSVSGKVFFKGKAAQGYYLTLIAIAGKRSFSTYIHGDGTYFFRSPIPPGQYTVIVEKGPALAEKLPALKVQIPERYRHPGTSGITIQVSEGDQRRDLDLKE